MPVTYDYEWFKKQIFQITTINLDAYKEKQMKRRIDTLIQKYRVEGYDKFVELLRKDEEVLNAFVSYLTINVSEFFRNQDQWKFMDEQLIPELMKKFGHQLKIWSAACSTGDEPYTIVMLLSKHLPLAQIKVLAYDLDKIVLAKAKAGIYEKKEIQNVPEEFKKKYFKEVDKDHVQISDDIKRRVEFKQADLLRDPYPTDCHLIVCRNVLIYFTEEAKDDIFRKYYKSLKPEGVLFIGSTEQMINYQEIGYIRRGSFFYEKPAK